MSLSEKDLYLRRYLETKVINCETDSDAHEFYEYLKSLGPVDHIVRYIETYNRMLAGNLVSKGFDYCETGDLSCVSQYLVGRRYRLEAAKGDFRYEIIHPTASIDILLSFEVMEHIKDQDARNFDDIVLFNYSGVRAYAKECFRMLRPHGKLVLTTPNACSLASIVNALEYRSPSIYMPHVKEYAPSEVIQIFNEVGFSLAQFDTFFSYFHLDDNEQAMKSIFSHVSHSNENRGDTSYFVFKKAS